MRKRRMMIGGEGEGESVFNDKEKLEKLKNIIIELEFVTPMNPIAINQYLCAIRGESDCKVPVPDGLKYNIQNKNNSDPTVAKNRLYGLRLNIYLKISHYV
jgi:hypothetical protein